MFKIIALLVVTLGAGFLSAHLYPELGEVNILVAHTRISAPLGMVMSVILCAFVFSSLAWRSIYGIYFLAKKFVNVLGGKDHHLASLIYNKAMYEYYAGNYAEAKSLFIKAAGGTEEPLINYLQAAKCAHLLKKYLLRDKLIMRCHSKFGDGASLINFHYAAMCAEQGDYEKGLSLLLSVDSQEVNQDQYLKLKTSLLYNSENFYKLVELLPEININKIFSSYLIL